MGIDIIQLHESQPPLEVGRTPENLAQLSFRSYDVPSSDMSIWLSLTQESRVLFPWFPYNMSLENDIKTLHDVWGVASAQSLFDCLFLSFLKKTAGSNFYVIFPGNIKMENWGQVRERDKEVFLRGQGCVYHLQGAFSTKLMVNWVPFWQPQSLVKDPPFGSLWRLFVNSHTDDVSKSICFFQLSNPRLLPVVAGLLIDADEKRSEKLASTVDWFGVYSSPLHEDYRPGVVVYSKQKQIIQKFVEKQQSFTASFQEAQQQLLNNPLPQTAIRILSRHIAL